MNIPEVDDDGNTIFQVKLKAFAHRDNNTFDGQGYKFTAVKGTTTMGMFSVPDNCEFAGIEIINGALGDTVHLRVMHPTEDITLDQFGTNWNMRDGVMTKVLNYASFIPATFRICVPYTNNDTVNDRIIYVNLDLHKKIT